MVSLTLLDWEKREKNRLKMREICKGNNNAPLLNGVLFDVFHKV